LARHSRKKRGGRRPPARRGRGEADRGRPSSRAERDAARRRRAEAARAVGGRPRATRGGTRERPPAPWGSFPLTELVVLAGIVIAVIGLVKGGSQGRLMLGMGVALGSLGGLELSVREHFAGYRSHTTLLAGAGAAAAMLIVTIAATPVAAVPLVVGVGVFAAAFFVLRRVFRRRSGGLSFR
jgi:hypothetical protein